MENACSNAVSICDYAGFGFLLLSLQSDDMLHRVTKNTPRSTLHPAHPSQPSPAHPLAVRDCRAKDSQGLLRPPTCADSKRVWV